MLTIVVVCFHSAAEFRGCLDTVFSGPVGHEIKVVAVNNSQDDHDDIAAICQDFSVELIQNPENVGYGRGCNIGARAAVVRALRWRTS